MPYRGFINISFILRHIGKLLFIEAALMLFPLIISIFEENSNAFPFIAGTVICTLIGCAFLLFVKPKKTYIGRQESFLIVGLSWIIFCLFGSIPFYLSNLNLGFTNSLFETISGFTTTGATILSNIAALPKAILFWRSFMQWVGGIGIIVLTTFLIPTAKHVSLSMYAAEFTGPSKEQLHAKVNKSLRHIILVYITLTLLQTITLWIMNFNLFDSICYAFSTISTGGFALTDQKLLTFSPAIQNVFTIFMFLAATNYILLFTLFVGKIIKVWKDEQLRWYILFFIIAGISISILTLFLTNSNSNEAFRNGFFYAASFLSTTGYIISDNTSVLPPIILSIFYILMLIGGCSGSGSGGFKIIRFVLFWKNMFYEFSRQIHPRAVVPVRYNKIIVGDDILRNIMAFLFLFAVILGSSIFLLTLFGSSFRDSVSFAISSLSNAGPALGTVCTSCSYINLSEINKWIIMLLMILGRLEIYTLLFIFSRFFWKK